MCQRATCKSCGKATYRGCGLHVEQVLAGVPAEQRCGCEAAARPSSGEGGAGRGSGGLFARLRRRRN